MRDYININLILSELEFLERELLVLNPKGIKDTSNRTEKIVFKINILEAKLSKFDH